MIKKETVAHDNNLISKTLHRNLEFTAREQYKLLRTNLSFTLPEDEKCPIVGITSSIRGEGKSTTAINLAYVLAESGKKVLLIDGDLRIPSIAKKLKIKKAEGLTDLLMSSSTEYIQNFDFQHYNNWYIITSGDLPPNPSELLGSSRMGKLLSNLKEHFDFILVDLPPVNLVSDALAISKYLSGMILVVREGHTEKTDFDSCVRQLKLSSAKILGCVMNETKNGRGYYSKYKSKSAKYNSYGSK